jgi:hypothetical protein
MKLSLKSEGEIKISSKENWANLLSIYLPYKKCSSRRRKTIEVRNLNLLKESRYLKKE